MTRRFPTDTRAVLVEVAPVGIFYQVVRNGFGTSGKRSPNNRGHSLEERTHFYLIIWLVFRLVLATLGSTPLSSSLTLKDNASTNILNLGESAENYGTAVISRHAYCTRMASQISKTRDG